MSLFYSSDPTYDPGDVSACLSFSGCRSEAHTVKAFIISNHLVDNQVGVLSKKPRLPPSRFLVPSEGCSCI